MPANSAVPTHAPNPDNVENCDLLVIGAGLAGLNALWVATQYLPKTARVVIVDRNHRCGGMWIHTYDYVRLHQPHPYFTVGDIPWNWKKPPEYLANKKEILSHLEYCLDQIRSTINLQELYGYEVESTEELSAAPDGPLQVTCAPSGRRGTRRTFNANRVIQAIGNNVTAPRPLPLSSPQVRSITPNNLPEALSTNKAKPIYVVGGGKTGMDTVHTILSTHPDRKVIMINGLGTVFANRNYVVPVGPQRWWKGKLLLDIFGDVAMKFDGVNPDPAFEYFRENYSIGLDKAGEHCFFGYLSEEECDQIKDGLDTLILGYLSDVVDTASGPQLVLRDGTGMAIESGSFFVNCTGYLLRGGTPEVTNVIKNNKLLTISSRASLHFLSSVSAYFLTHLFYNSDATNAPVYAMDMDALFEKNRKIWFMAALTQAFMNPIILINALSLDTFEKCGLNTDRLFPLPRKLGTLLKVQLNKEKYINHCQAVLDRVAEQNGVRCGKIFSSHRT